MVRRGYAVRLGPSLLQGRPEAVRGVGPPAGPILALRVEDLLEKEALLAETSDAVFTIPHFDGFAAVLVQLSKVDLDELQDLVAGPWAACAPSGLVNEHLGDAER